MRILRVANLPNSPNSGMGRIMHRTSEEMRALGHEVDMLFAEDVPRGRAALLRSDRLAFPVAATDAVRARIAAGARFDVVEMHEPRAAWYVHARLRDRSLPPVAVISYGLEVRQWAFRLELDRLFGRKTSLKSRLLVPPTLLKPAMYGLRHADQALCINQEDEEFLVARHGFPREQITGYRCGVSDDFFLGGETRPETGAVPRLLFVGSWIERKGRRFVVEAFTRLRDEFPGLTLSVIGAGIPEREVLDSFPEAVRDGVRALERADDAALREAYSRHDVFLFPTFHEAWGLVLLEAAAAGLAIVSTNQRGPGEILEADRSGLLIPPGDGGALTDALRRVVADPALRRRLREGAVRRAREFSWRRTAQDLLRGYERAIAAARAAGRGRESLAPISQAGENR